MYLNGYSLLLYFINMTIKLSLALQPRKSGKMSKCIFHISMFREHSYSVAFIRVEKESTQYCDVAIATSNGLFSPQIYCGKQFCFFAPKAGSGPY